jgi:hypothetical protein
MEMHLRIEGFHRDFEAAELTVEKVEQPLTVSRVTNIAGAELNEKVAIERWFKDARSVREGCSTTRPRTQDHYGVSSLAESEGFEVHAHKDPGFVGRRDIE